jgi:hypothetical protein
MTFEWIVGVLAIPAVGWAVSVERRISSYKSVEAKVDTLNEKVDRLLFHMLDKRS